jgi:aspartate kinase
VLIVQKYGGTSVGSIDRMKNVAARCLATQRKGHKVAVVVSAMSGETNRLLELTRQIQEDPNDREVDVIISTGEQVSVGLVALAIRAAGGKARSFLGHQCKIVTDSAFSRARIVSIESQPIKDALDAGEIAVIAGFQGVDDKGSITTLGRGGSDTTGVAIAAALNADVRSERVPVGEEDRQDQLRGDARARVARREGPADPLGRARHEVRRADPRSL